MKRCDCFKHKHCLHCGVRMKIRAKTVNGYCDKCWGLMRASVDPDINLADSLECLRGRKKCIVRGCENMSDQGAFIGDLCSPCHAFVATGEGRYSQAYRNSLQIMAANFSRKLINIFVGACDPTIARLGRSISDDELDNLTRQKR